MQGQSKAENPTLDQLEQWRAGATFHAGLAELLEGGRLFQDFSYEEINRVTHSLQAYHIPKAIELYEEGGCTNFLSIIIQGKLDVYKEAAGAVRKKIATARAGSILGEVSFIDGQPHSASVVSATEATIAILTRDGLDTILSEYPLLGSRVVHRIAWHLAARLRQTSGALVDHLSW